MNRAGPDEAVAAELQSQRVARDLRMPTISVWRDPVCILTSESWYIMMPTMRTTLTIDRDVEQLLRREMQRTGSSMKAVVNDALRVGLGIRGKPPQVDQYQVQPHAFGFRPGVDLDRLNQLVDELEADEFARRFAK